MSNSDLGPISPDGCPVEVYARLPAGAAPSIIHGAVPEGASILDLGAGAGRITHPLLDLGHDVVAVDDSPEMLAHIRGAETIFSSIEELDLHRQFDVVLLLSHLIEKPDDGQRRMFLEACRRHVSTLGQIIIQRDPPERHDVVQSFRRYMDGYVLTMRDVERPSRDLLKFTLIYEIDGRTWTERVVTRRLEDKALEKELDAAGLKLDGFLTPDRSWVRARPVIK